MDFFLELLSQVIGWVLDVWIWNQLYSSRPTLFGESRMDRQAPWFQFVLILAAAGIIVLVWGAVSLYRRHFGS